MATVAHDGDAVAMFENLCHAMRNIDDGNAALGQPVHDPEKCLGFGLCQRCRWLIEDQDAAIQRQRLGNLNDLLLRNRKAARAAGGIDVADLPQHRCRPLFQVAVIHEPGTASTGL